MTTLSWDALGGDPAPGDPGAFDDLARSFSETAENAGSAHGKLTRFATSVDDSIWSGEAADAFREKIGELPPRLEKLHASYGAAAEGMGDYARTLRDLQDRARALLGRAQGAQDEKASQERSRDQAQAADPTAPAGVYDAAIADAEGRLRGVRREIEELRDQRVAAEHRALGRLEDAEALGIKNDPWYKRAFDAVDRFIDEHADILRTISGALKVISAIAGVLSFIPFLAPICGPIALIAGGLALLTDAALAATGNGDWKALLVDAALMALPGAGRLLGTALKGTRVGVAAGRAVKGAKGAAGGAARSVGAKIPGPLRSVAGKARPFFKRVCRGDPIDVATGEVVMTQTDVELPGALPLVLTRTFGSLSPVSGSFGASWSSSLDQMLEIDGEGVSYAAPDGMILIYPIPAVGDEVLAAEGPRWPLRRSEEASYTITDPERGLSFFFSAPIFNSNIWPLRALADRNGHRIGFDHDAEGTVTGIRHCGGYHIEVESSAGLITALRLRDPDAGEGHLLMRYGYDAAGRLSEVINSSGAPLRFDHDASGRIIAWEDRNGAWYRYTYDEQGRCVKTSGSQGCLDAAFAYDAENRVTVMTDSLGHATTYHLNDSDQVIGEIDPLGNAVVSEWDRYDRLVSRTDALGRRTAYSYDQAGNIVSVTRPDGSQILTEHNELGLPVRITDPDGAVWLREYDQSGNLLVETDPLGATTRYVYGDQGHLSEVIDALGYLRQIETDAAGLPVSITDSLGASTRYRRDPLGQVVEVTDAHGGVTRFGWTLEGKLTSRTLPDGTTERWRYDAEGNLIEQIDAVGQVTLTEIGPFGFPRARTGPDGARLAFTRDTELRLVAVTNPQGLVWRYEYDPAGDLVREIDFNGRATIHAYDAAGQLVERTNGAGETARFAHDPLGNVVEQRAGEGLTRFSHDGLGRLTKATNADCELKFERDALGQVLVETCNGRSVISTYDALGRRVERRTPSGATTTWEYGAADKPLALHAGGHSLRFFHDALGREIERRLGNGVTISQSWDASHRLVTKGITVSALGSAEAPRLVQHRSYTYRADGFVVGVDDLLSGNRRFDLDPIGHITAATAAGGPGQPERYTYDAAGNVTSATWQAPAGPASAAMDALDAQGEREYAGTLIRRAGKVRYEHDAQGRVVLRQEKRLSAKPRTWRYAWDADDRLMGVVTPDGQRWRYRYDPLGRRISKERLGKDHESIVKRVDFTWDGFHLAEETHPTVQESGLRLPDGHCTTWEWEPGTFRPVVQMNRGSLRDAPQETIDEKFHAIVTDLVGTPAELISPEGNIAWRQHASAWGIAVFEGMDGVKCPLRFPGQYFDAETQSHYNVFRYYDPYGTRYLTSDPLGLAAGANPHAYVPNPSCWIDPLGLTSGAGQGEIGVHPDELRFSQRTAGGGTPPRAPVLRQQMASGWDPSKGPIDVVQTEHGLVTFDNTRVAVAQELGLDGVTARVHQTADALPPGFAEQRGLLVRAERLGLPAPATWEDALRIRTKANRLPIEGTATRPRLPC